MWWRWWVRLGNLRRGSEVPVTGFSTPSSIHFFAQSTHFDPFFGISSFIWMITIFRMDKLTLLRMMWVPIMARDSASTLIRDAMVIRHLGAPSNTSALFFQPSPHCPKRLIKHCRVLQCSDSSCTGRKHSQLARPRR